MRKILIFLSIFVQMAFANEIMLAADVEDDTEILEEQEILLSDD